MPQPKRIAGAEPEYLEAAKKDEIRGKVILVFTITPAGDVHQVRIIKSLPILGEVCAEAVKRWKFAPFPWEDPRAHSCRSASMGSRRDALRAG